MDERVRQGKKIVITVLAICLWVSLGHGALYLMALDLPVLFIRQLGILVFLGIECISLYRGSTFTRWCFVGFLSLYALITVWLSLALIDRTLAALLLLIPAALYIGCAWALAFSKSVQPFLKWQWARRRF